jgi:hypothetical protein
MSTWTEPAVVLPRWWGNYHARYSAGLALIVLGIGVTNLSSTYSLWFLLAGPVLHVTGWLLLPGALWRRLLVLLPCLLGGLALLAGAQFAGAFALLLAGWLLVRNRPAISYLTLALPILAAIVFRFTLNDYSQNWIMLAAGTAAVVGAAWLARFLAIMRHFPSESQESLR